ncbi:acyl-CoA thioesterase [Natrinema sp. LN54]|uniref:acyl-CoA thioesterase n=1 Tax=Natrinema sp. LN54 TaxID=3458705 RepID=UPI004036250D
MSCTTLVETHIENRVWIQPNDTNHYDIAHGGNVMKWMDEAGALASMRFAGETCVTARMEQVDFQQPIPRGDTAIIEAYVYEAEDTSVRVRLSVYRENPQTGNRELTTQSYFVYVAINEAHEPVPVPDLSIKTYEGGELHRQAIREEPRTQDPLPATS